MPYPANLDYICAVQAERLFASLKTKDKALNHVQKSLGILQEDGLYAFAVFQDYRAAKGGEEIMQACKDLLTAGATSPLLLPEPPQNFLEFCRVLSGQSLDKLFLARDLILRTLVYTYYHLRALAKNQASSGAPGD